MVLCTYLDPTNSKGEVYSLNKGASVWPFNACNEVATG